MIGLIFLILCLLAVFAVDTNQKRRKSFGEDK
jgi:hypothetical protein